MTTRSKFAPRTVRASEKAKLLAAVGQLVAQLGRPVSSVDLRRYLSNLEDQDQAPYFAQCWGQVLIKAARPRPTPFPYLRCLGKVGNRAYYAMEDTQELRLALGRYNNTLRAKVGAWWRMAESVTNLIGTPYEAQARNAAAGFVEEFGPLTHLDERLANQVAEVRKWVVAPFVAVEPTDWITKQEALNLLRQTALRFMEQEEADQIKYQKILSAWQWPQSNLFPKGEIRYSKAQILLVAEVRWSFDCNNDMTASALLGISKVHAFVQMEH